MNITIQSSHIKFVGVNENLSTLAYRDDIGFTTQDLYEGYNYSDATTPAEDGVGVNYPTPEEMVLFMFAWHIPYTVDQDTDPDAVGTVLTVNRISKEVLDPVSETNHEDPTFDYGDVMNNWEIVSADDGWIVVKMYGLLVDNPGEDYYYRSTDGAIIRASDDTELLPNELVDVVPTARADMYKHAQISHDIGEIMSKYTMLQIRGACSDEDAWRKHIDFLQMGLTASKIQFDTFGNTWNAAFILEELQRYIVVNNLDDID